MMNPSIKSLNGSRGLLANVLDDEALMLVLNGSIIGYFFFSFAVFVAGFLYSLGQEGLGLSMVVLLPAFWSILPAIALGFMHYELKEYAAVTLSFAGFTPWLVLNTSFHDRFLFIMTTIFSLVSCAPFFGLVLRDLKTKRVEVLPSFLLTLLFLSYLVFLNPIPNGPSLLSWGWWSLLIPIAEYLAKIIVRYTKMHGSGRRTKTDTDIS